MSKRTYESGSSKPKKATAKADALRAVIEKTKPITQFFIVPERSAPEVVTDPELIAEGSCVFLSDPAPESKICEKPDPESLFIFSSSRSLCGFRI